MHNIFKAYDSENEEIKKYTIREISKEKIEQMEKLENEAQGIVKKTNGPLWLRIIAYIAIWIGIILFASALSARSEAEKVTNVMRIVLIVGIVICLIGAVIIFYLKNNAKKISNDSNTLNLVDDINKSIEDSYNELNIPSNAISMDIFFVPIKVTRKGEEKHMKALYTYINKELKVFVEEDNLCFADNYRVIALKLSSFKNIVKINKRITIPFWNKEKSFIDAEYKDYKIKSNAGGLIFLKSYYSIKHELNNLEYEFLIPNYELNNLLSILPLEVIEDKQSK